MFNSRTLLTLAALTLVLVSPAHARAGLPDAPTPPRVVVFESFMNPG